MENGEHKWCNWCRLCGKEDCESSENIKFEDPSDDSVVGENSLKHILEKYFCIPTSSEINMPRILCFDCNTFLSSLLEFSERVKRVQQMYAHLMNMDSSCDLKAIRIKFNVSDDYRHHVYGQLPMTEVVPISCRNPFKDCSIKEEINNIAECDEEPLECNILADEADPFESMMDNNKYNSSDCSSEKETRTTRRKRLCRKRRIRETAESVGNDTTRGTETNYKLSIPFSEEKLQNYDTNHIPNQNHAETVGKMHTASSDAVTDDEIHVEKFIRTKQTRERVQNRKKKEEVRIDYTMDASCAVCSEKFELFSAYCEHMLQSHVNNQWKCVTCNRELQSRYDFERHLRKHLPKSSIIKHICTICGLRLSCSTTLKRHLSVHSDKMQHLCDHCGRAFKRDTTLKAHMILHTGLKPYACNFCQLTFACSSNCRRHMRKAHSEEFAAFQTFGCKTQTKNTI